MSLTNNQILKIKNKLKIKQNITITSTKNIYTIYSITTNTRFYITLNTFPNTCGIFIASRLSSYNFKQKSLAFNIIYEIAKIKRKSAIIYLTAEWQYDIIKILETQKWKKLNNSFINKNSRQQNTLYIKH